MGHERVREGKNEGKLRGRRMFVEGEKRKKKRKKER